MINPKPNTSQTKLQDLHQNNSRAVISTGTFAVMYPLSAALKIPVIDAGPGFDEVDLENKLGKVRFDKLIKGVKEVFCCNHACYLKTVPDSHRIQGYEVHCCYAADVEKFLQTEG